MRRRPIQGLVLSIRVRVTGGRIARSRSDVIVPLPSYRWLLISVYQIRKSSFGVAMIINA